MHVRSRSFLLAILVAVLIGHASLVAHAATHAGLEGADCEICVSYGDTQALASEAGETECPDAETIIGSDSGATIKAGHSCDLRQRGPPANY